MSKLTRAILHQRAGEPRFVRTPRVAPLLTHDGLRFKSGDDARRCWLSEDGHAPISVVYRGASKDDDADAVVEAEDRTQEVVPLADLYATHAQALAASMRYCRDHANHYDALERHHARRMAELESISAEQWNRMSDLLEAHGRDLSRIEKERNPGPAR